MEGKIDQNDLKIKKIAVAVIIIFHFVGLVGFLIPVAQPYFIKLVPFHLLLMFAIIIFSYNADVKHFYESNYVINWRKVNSSFDAFYLVKLVTATLG
ncbi:hypothetical protein [Pedobacter mucosus]|uniref:hypothetical protein n=1 Tax=Pedobacter mucosus TaxID=2895286 RepID=UPI001EE3DA80|nr:hypothetical protein [Pedobacter mucosus]UKT64163.1 hypothetical protein LOK61_20645 [Pedobacter mucosus]